MKQDLLSPHESIPSSATGGEAAAMPWFQSQTPPGLQEDYFAPELAAMEDTTEVWIVELIYMQEVNTWEEFVF